MVFTPTKILVTVMTYPLPSRGYQEIVCTAGITETFEWVRLYPIPFRYTEPEQQFQKYQWIEVGLAEHGSGNDKRKESRKPDINSIRILGEPLSVKNDWLERRLVIDKMPVHALEELQELYSKDNTSLGIVRPGKIIDLEIRQADPNWKPEWQTLFSQMRLFGSQQKPLKKIPFTFHYIFEDTSGKRHTAMCEDWELGVLYLREEERLGSPEKASESVRNRFLNELCTSNRDTRFFMGTFFPYNVWLVLGVFYPKRQATGSLF